MKRAGETIPGPFKTIDCRGLHEFDIVTPLIKVEQIVNGTIANLLRR
jgi:hypothetical protein